MLLQNYPNGYGMERRNRLENVAVACELLCPGESRGIITSQEQCMEPKFQPVDSRIGEACSP